MATRRSSHANVFWRGFGVLVSIVLILSLVWWMVGRVTLDDRRVAVREWGGGVEAPVDSAGTLRILAWNIAHGRGDVGSSVLHNWQGGSHEERAARLARIAQVIREADPDIVVLNEADFDSHWSYGLNQAEVLARALGYRAWVEQRNYDLRIPFATLSFGNAVLSRFPIEEARWIRIAPHSRMEAMVFGAKSASVVHLDTFWGRISVVPVHLEVRSEETRLSAIPTLDSLQIENSAPLVLAGDFNSSPPGWPGAGPRTALGALLDRGWSNPRAEAEPNPLEWTFPTYDPARAIDWVLVEPPLRAVEAEVVEGAGALSDHAPVLYVLTFDDVN